MTTTMTFAVQGLITVCVVVPVIVLTHKFGPKIRAKRGLPSWVDLEYDVL